MTDTILGLPPTIQNSDDETMPIYIQYQKETKDWYISYSDEGSNCSVTGKTLTEAVENMKKQVKEYYGETL